MFVRMAGLCSLAGIALVAARGAVGSRRPGREALASGRRDAARACRTVVASAEARDGFGIGPRWRRPNRPRHRRPAASRLVQGRA